MRTISARTPLVHWLAAVATIAAIHFASASAHAAERRIGGRPARTLAAINTASSLSLPRPAVARPSLPAPSFIEWAGGATHSAALQFAADGSNHLCDAVTRMQGSVLGWAIAARKQRLVAAMLHLGISPNARNFRGMNPLLHAIGAEDGPLVARLLAIGADPNGAGPQQMTPLMMAASTGHLEIIQALLQNGAQVDAADAKGQTPLHYALATRKREAMDTLLAANAGVSSPGIIPLAVETRDWSFIQPVMERVQSRAWDSPTRLLLAQAIREKNTDHLRLLLSKHKGPATLEGVKDPLLLWAVVTNELNLMRMLLEAGADPNTTLSAKPEDRLLNAVPFKKLKHYLAEEPGMNLMCVAAGMGHSEMLRLLIAHGAEKNRPTRSKHRLVPLYFAAWGNHVGCLQTLIDNAPAPDRMRIEISLLSQEATLYKNGTQVFRTAISSGQEETPTPTGQFVVTDKKRHHTSNLYDAKMPFFMRLSCKDFGMHEGFLPGFPASHGCIRLPGDSARQLFRDVPIGTLVTIR